MNFAGSRPAFFTASRTAPRMARLEKVAPLTRSTLSDWFFTTVSGIQAKGFSATAGVSKVWTILMSVMRSFSIVTSTITSSL